MPTFLQSKAIREEIADGKANLETFVELIDGEDRTPTAEEQADIDAQIQTIGMPANGDDPATGLYAKLARAEKFEAIKAAKVGGDIPAQQAAPGASEGGVIQLSRITVPAQYKRHGKLKAYKGPDAEKKAFIAGQFCLASVWGHQPAIEWCENNGIALVRNAMSGIGGAKGGFLTPETMESSIIELRESYGVFRMEAGFRSMPADVHNFPKDNDEVTTYFVQEGVDITDDDNDVTNVELVARKLAALVKHSSEISEDAVVSVGDFITRKIAHGFAKKEDECGFNGNGEQSNGGITGVLNAVNAGAIHQAATGKLAFSDLEYLDFETVVGKLPQYAAGNAKWYVSRAGFYASMANLANANGGNTKDDAAEGPNAMQFMGHPVVFSQVLNSTLGDQADAKVIIFGDLEMGAYFGERRGIDIAASEHRYFESDQIGIRGTERFGINVHEVGDATTAGSLVVLQLAAS